MRSIFIVIALFICQVRLHAQDRFFLYVQTDNEQAFYARVQGRTLSSSASGYLILPRISDSSLSLTIGFPKRLFPEQTFHIKDIRSDKGFVLKNTPDKGWILADMQSSVALLASSAEAPRASDPPARSSADPFSELLSTVINDSSLSETPIVRNPPVPSSKPELPVKQPSIRDTQSVQAPKPIPQEAAQKPVVAVDATPSVKTDDAGSQGKGSRKILEQIDGTGVQIVYSDETSAGITDTISVWIPKDKSPGPAPRAVSARTTTVTGDTAQSAAKMIPDRTDCKSFVSATNLALLRRRMEALTDEDAKVALALRSFRESCFSTEQIRNLLMVFGREEGRFKLLDAAYPYVSDPSKFTELESVLKDSYFIYRFRKKTSAPTRQ